MKSEAYSLLESQFLRTRVSQNMPFQTLDSLASSLPASQLSSLTRLILRTKTVTRRTSLDNHLLMRCIVTFQYFQTILKDKGQKALFEVCRHLYYSEVPQGKYVYEIGEPADRFFVVMKGEVSVQAPHTVQPPEEDQEDQEVLLAEQEIKEVVRLPVGEVFGETSMRENAKRAMSVQAIRDCEFFEIKKRDYEIIIKYTIVSAMRAKYMFLEEIELFTKLSNSNFQSLLYLIDIKEVKIGHKLYSEGDEVDYIYVVKSGQFKLQKTIPEHQPKDALSKLKQRYPRNKQCGIFVVSKKEILGDSEMFQNGIRHHTCVCITQHADVFRITRKDFESKVIADTNNDINGILEYLYFKDLHISRRIGDYNKVTQSMQNRRYSLSTEQQTASRYPPKRPSPTVKDLNNITVSRIGNRQYDTDSRTPYQIKKSKRRSIRSNFESSTQTIALKQSTVPFAARLISQIVKQKKKYISLRGTWFENAFDLKAQLPTYFRVKMNLDKDKDKEKCKTDVSEKSLGKEVADTTFLTTAKTAETRFRKTRLRVKTETDAKRQQVKSATPKTIYGKFFETLLDV